MTDNLAYHQDGGKDSCYNMMQCVNEGHDIVALANLRPKQKDELDSYMYQTVGHHAIELYAEAMDLLLYRRTIEGSSLEQGREYCLNPDDEVEDLYQLLKQIKEEVGVEGVSVGAILSDYQRVRVEHVCVRLGLTPLAFLWRRDQDELLDEMVQCGVDAIIIKVAALGLEPDKHLGKTLAEIQPHMRKMKALYGLNVCGEGGEYETFTRDCPLFNKKIIVDVFEQVLHSDDAFAPVAYLNLHKLHLEDKHVGSETPWLDRLKSLPLKSSVQLHSDLDLDSDADDGSVSLQSLESCSACQQNQLKGDYLNVRQTASGFVYISGLSAKSQEGKQVEDLMKQVMDCLQKQLMALGLEMKHLVASHLYVQNMPDFARLNSVCKSYFAINPPIRVCVQASNPPNVVLLLDCVAYKSIKDSMALQRNTMHVQGLSHWAPANIGPYSQAVQVGDLLYIAGLIALHPSNLTLIEGGIIAQARLSLQHLQRVISAMTLAAGFLNALTVICYVTHTAYIPHVQSEVKRVIAQERNNEAYGVNRHVAPLIEYVVVETLPHGALVEWHPCVCTAGPDCCISSDQITKTFQDFNISVNFISISSHPAVFSFVASLGNAARESSAQMPPVRDLMLPLCQAVDAAWKACQLQMSHDEGNTSPPHLPTFRLFYRANLFDMDRLWAGCNDVLEEVFGEKHPLVAVVPAVSFHSESQILSICL